MSQLPARSPSDGDKESPGLPGCSSWAVVYTVVLLVFAAVVTVLALWTRVFA